MPYIAKPMPRCLAEKVSARIASRAAVERRLAIMGAVLSAVILESHFRPKLRLDGVLEELYEALVHV